MPESEFLQQPATIQILVLLTLSAVVACVAWTVTHEEVFKEVHEYCVQRSKNGKSILIRKFFYLFTCEYCFSHYVSALVILLSGYRLLADDWRGFIVALFALVWVANFQMAAFARIRLEVKLDRIEIDAKTDEDGNALTAAPAKPLPKSKGKPEPRL